MMMDQKLFSLPTEGKIFTKTSNAETVFQWKLKARQIKL